MWRVKKAAKKIFGEDLDEANKRLYFAQQIGWLIGIMVWVPGLILWVGWLSSQ